MIWKSKKWEYLHRGVVKWGQKGVKLRKFSKIQMKNLTLKCLRTDDNLWVKSREFYSVT